MIQTLTRVHIIIDALDECISRDDIGSTIGILSWIEEIVSSCSNASLMVASQPLDEIPLRIQEILIQSSSAEDIEPIRTWVRDSDDFKRWKESPDTHTLDEIEETLSKEANRMLVTSRKPFKYDPDIDSYALRSGGSFFNWII